MIRREKIKIVTNRPLVIQLEDEGTETHSNYTGREIRYACLHKGAECLLYLPLEADAVLRRIGAQPGDQIELLKSANGQYSARVFSDAHLPVGPQPQPTRMLAPQRQQPAQQSQQPPPAQPAKGPGEIHPIEQIMTRCLEIGAKANWTAFFKTREFLKTTYNFELDPHTLGPAWEDCRASGNSVFIERTNKQNQQGGGR